MMTEYIGKQKNGKKGSKNAAPNRLYLEFQLSEGKSG